MSCSHLLGATQEGQAGAAWMGPRSGPWAALPPTRGRLGAQGVLAKGTWSSPRPEPARSKQRGPCQSSSSSLDGFPRLPREPGDFTLLHTARLICSTNSYANKLSGLFFLL